MSYKENMRLFEKCLCYFCYLTIVNFSSRSVFCDFHMHTFAVELETTISILELPIIKIIT